MMTYYESADGIEIDKARVIKELRRHGCTEEEVMQCFAEIGPGPTWDAQAVLRWLHY